MKILHTADWHIGKTLYGRKRYEEFEQFLNWLTETIRQEQVDTLLVSGDVFDTTAPSNRAQGLYYRFLCRVAGSSCRHVVVTGGNHDSPSFLNAPRELLKALDVHVVGSISENPEDEVLVLTDPIGAPELIVCAVPYLRDRDIRVAETGESIDDKDRKLVEGIRGHYAAVVDFALRKRKELSADIPIIAMGHLFTAGGKTVDGDGVRDLYVGSLAKVNAGIFPECLDYVALGHLHVPQKVSGSEKIRYSGSPLPMGYGEAKQQKIVCMVQFNSRQAEVSAINIPVFQELERIKGGWKEIQSKILELSAVGSRAWLEIVYEGDEVIGDLPERLDHAISDSKLEILATKNSRITNSIIEKFSDHETLDDLNVDEVFERCLSAHGVPEDQRELLLRTYKETVFSINDEDQRKE